MGTHCHLHLAHAVEGAGVCWAALQGFGASLTLRHCCVHFAEAERCGQVVQGVLEQMTRLSGQQLLKQDLTALSDPVNVLGRLCWGVQTLML